MVWTKISFQGHKEKKKKHNRITSTLQSDRPHTGPPGEGDGGAGSGGGAAGTLAPSIYRTAGGCFRGVGSTVCRAASWAAPSSPTSGNQLEGFGEQPAGSGCCPLCLSLTRVGPSSGKRMPASKTPWPLNPLQGHTQPTPQASVLEHLSRPLAPKAAGFAHEITGLVACNDKGVLFCPGKGVVSSLAGPGQGWQPPRTQNKMTHGREQTETEGSRPGWRRRAEAPPRGRGLVLETPQAPAEVGGAGRQRRR